jgi:O-acetyl-ADP-ribose deacetylase (regulator of RNase III)
MKTIAPSGQAAASTLRLSLGDLNLDVAEEDGAGLLRRCRGRGGSRQPARTGLRRRRQPGQQFRRHEWRHRQGRRELPVGAALVVEVPARRFPFVIAAPTVRVPGSVTGSINAYLAMRAALVAVLRHNAGAARQIRSLATPGLGTGVGGIDARQAAEQMRQAYDNVVGEKWRQVVHPAQAPYALGKVRLVSRKE